MALSAALAIPAASTITTAFLTGVWPEANEPSKKRTDKYRNIGIALVTSLAIGVIYFSITEARETAGIGTSGFATKYTPTPRGINTCTTC